MRTLAGVDGIAPVDDAAFDVDPSPRSAPLAAAAFQLAKAGRLVPALIGFDYDGDAVPGVLTIAVRDVVHHAPRFGHHALQLLSRARVPLAEAVECEIAVFRDEHSLAEHVAVVIGQPDAASAVPVRLHSACLTGDLLGSLRCDCGEQLRTAVARIGALGGGVLLYLDQEGRGIGLPNKLRAYVLQDGGLDTVDADQHLGFLADERSYDVAAALLTELGYKRIRLLTNNPQKINSLRDHGIEVVGPPAARDDEQHAQRALPAREARARGPPRHRREIVARLASLQSLGELSRKLGGGNLLATAGVLPGPQRREVALALRLGSRAQRRDRRGGQRERGREGADRPELPHQAVHDAARRPSR